MMVWKEQLNGDCPKRDAHSMHERCDLICPGSAEGSVKATRTLGSPFGTFTGLAQDREHFRGPFRFASKSETCVN
jgi:hypothetical protein